MREVSKRRVCVRAHLLAAFGLGLAMPMVAACSSSEAGRGGHPDASGVGPVPDASSVVDADAAPDSNDARPDASDSAVDSSGPTDGGVSEADAFADGAVSETNAPGDTDAACGPDSGAVVMEKWDFTVSAASDGGLGQVLTIHVCDTIVWVNDDDGVPHSVVSDGTSGYSFMTETVTGTMAGVPFAPIQFPIPGTFLYECGVHGSIMRGQVTVAP